MAFDAGCINVWSGPRCVSTSLMYSFAQRADTAVLDEPLYAHFLLLTGAERPYREQVLASQEHDGRKVVQSLLGPRQKKYLYVKHMAKQYLGLDPELLQRAKHVLLVREPLGVLRSFSEVLQPTLRESCYPALLELHSELRARGRPPPVVLSDDLVREPEGTLRALCAELDVEFDPKMLSWPAGPRPEDGAWAPWWYGTTHRSTGFAPPAGRSASGPPGSRPPLPDALKHLLEECRPLYELLARRAVRPLPVGVGRGLPGAAAGAPSVEALSLAAAAASGRADQVRRLSSTHAYEADPRNADVLIGIRDGLTGRFDLVWRPEARISVFDSGFLLGDGVWEGLRLHRGVLLSLAGHVGRLFEGAKAVDMDIGLAPEEVAQLVYDTCDANGMGPGDSVHVRLMVTRGIKPTPYQDPATTLGRPTVVAIAEHKRASAEPLKRGVRLATVAVVRGPPHGQDPGWNSHSKLNCIAACIQAKKAGADEALMLDPAGFVATCNSVNFFCVRRGEVWAPTTKYQLNGITRQAVLQLCREHAIPARELDFALTQVYSADESFVTGTFGGLTPVVEVDGRRIGSGRRGPLTQRLQELYAAKCDADAARGREAGLADLRALGDWWRPGGAE